MWIFTNVNAYADWPDLWHRNLNWRNFSFVRYDLEWGVYKGRYLEVSLGLLGFNFSFEIADNRTHAAWLAEMDQKTAQVTDVVRHIAAGETVVLLDDDDDDDDDDDGGHDL
jgi:hypothetical protein